MDNEYKIFLKQFLGGDDLGMTDDIISYYLEKSFNGTLEEQVSDLLKNIFFNKEELKEELGITGKYESKMFNNIIWELFQKITIKLNSKNDSKDEDLEEVDTNKNVIDDAPNGSKNVEIDEEVIPKSVENVVEVVPKNASSEPTSISSSEEQENVEPPIDRMASFEHILNTPEPEPMNLADEIEQTMNEGVSHEDQYDLVDEEPNPSIATKVEPPKSKILGLF